jgi:hypothetical protein
MNKLVGLLNDQVGDKAEETGAASAFSALGGRHGFRGHSRNAYCDFS